MGTIGRNVPVRMEDISTFPGAPIRTEARFSQRTIRTNSPICCGAFLGHANVVSAILRGRGTVSEKDRFPPDEVYVLSLTEGQVVGLEAELAKNDCPHDSLYPLIHSSFSAPGAWTHCNDCGAPVEITLEMEERWYDRYRDAVANGERYVGVMGYNDPDGTMPPMA